MKSNNVAKSTFYCVRCREPFILYRKVGRQKEPGHLKKIYCFKCNEDTKHAEIKEGAGKYTKREFDLEFYFGNFDSEGNRIQPYKTFINDLKQGGMVDYGW